MKRRSKRHPDAEALKRSVVDVTALSVVCTMRPQIDHAIKKRARDQRSDAGVLPTILMAGRLFARSQRFTMEMPPWQWVL